MHLTIKNGTRIPGGACGLVMGSNNCSVAMESPQVGGFVEGQHEIKLRRGALKRLMAY